MTTVTWRKVSLKLIIRILSIATAAVIKDIELFSGEVLSCGAKCGFELWEYFKLEICHYERNILLVVERTGRTDWVGGRKGSLCLCECLC